MKTLFFIAALAGAVYLIMQTPAGKAWLEHSEPELQTQPEIRAETRTETQVQAQKKSAIEQPENTLAVPSLENTMSQFAQRFNQKQQTQIDRLENRIAELENELVMGRIAEKQQQSASTSKVTLHPYNQPEKQFAAMPLEPVVDEGIQTQDTFAVITDNQLLRNRQARLQDIAAKMEMSSLQALVN